MNSSHLVNSTRSDRLYKRKIGPPRTPTFTLMKDLTKNKQWHSRTTELRKLFKLAAPTMVMQLLRFINPAISVMVCGHFSREELDAASLANTLINVFGLCIDTGFSTAFNTLFAQATLLVMLLLFTLAAAVHLNIGSVLLQLHQDPIISSLTEEYVKYFLPGLACDFLFLTLARYLQAQNIVLPMVYASVAATIFNVAAQYLIVVQGEFGLRASALCLSASFAVMPIFLIAHMIYSGAHRNLAVGFHLNHALDNWGIIFRMGIPGLFMIALEEWSFEILTFIAGTLGEVSLGAHAVAFQIQSIIYMIPLGIFTAVNIRVGQKLGAYAPEAAKFSFTTSMTVICGVALFTGLPVILLRHHLPLLFTEDAEVANLASKLLPMLLFFQLCEGFAGVAEAVLLACGRQTLGAITISIGYYFIGLPLGVLLTYKTDMGILGAWIGLFVGFAITTVVYCVCAFRTDWVAEARHACRNIHSQQEGPSDVEELLGPIDISMELSRNLEESVRQDANDRIEIRPNRTYPPLRIRCTDECRKWAFIASLSVIWMYCLYTTLKREKPLWLLVCADPIQHNMTEPRFCARMIRESTTFGFFQGYRE